DVTVVCVDAKSNTVLVAYESTKVGKLDVETGEIQQLSNCIPPTPVRGMKFSDDGSRLVIGCERGAVVSYNMKDRSQVLVSKERSNEWTDDVYCFSNLESSDHLIWARFGGAVYAKHVASDEPRMMAENAGFSHAMVQVPQLKAVAVSSGHDIRILQSDTGKLLAKCEGAGSMMWSLAIAGSQLFGGTWRGNLLVWNLGDIK
ncbi:MAG TPA: hypothetical protein VGM98_05365, partial [Schlesneria sp.]